MISRKALSYHLFCGLVIAAVCAGLLLSGAARLYAKEAYSFYQRQPVSPDNSAAAQPQNVRVEQTEVDRGSSDQWRAFIWESIPSEQLSGPGVDPVSEAYQKTGWKPFFMDSHFEINANGKLVLDLMGGLDDNAIDSTPFRLDELAGSIEKLNRGRSALKVVDPEMKDTRADALSQQATAQPAQQPTGDKAANPPPAVDPVELLQKYRDAFRAAGEVDFRLMAAFILYAKEMNPFLCDDQLKVLEGQIPLAEFLLELPPANYDSLASAYAYYRKLAAQGQQQTITVSGSLHTGESGNHVRELQKRLQQATFYRGQLSGTYDAETQRALKEFQAAHLIEPDGVVGQRTKEWLNVPFQQEVDMIAYAMKNLRQSQMRQYRHYIRINIPQYTLQYYKDGKVSETHRVVVGKATGKQVKFRGRMVGENQTPTLTSSIGQVILNPRWYVNDRISLELDVEAKSDPDYYSRHGYVQMSAVYPGGKPRIFQRPGPKNALGRVKFEFPNPFAVYLHDTPQKSLFQRSRRDFSHGCIRVDNALDLARTLLKDDSNSYAEKISSVLEGDRQTFVQLSQPVPIAIEYIPVVPDGNGGVIFVGDPYGIFKQNDSQKRERVSRFSAQ